ncbi:MAG: pilus assembly protein PilM [Candidatus Marinimicrobia bacterium]|nr:pilus assembly protein PilM [Candidatus Neomarinimicrobiota bacterium]
MSLWSPQLRVGIDIGNNSIKLIALNKKNNSVYRAESANLIGDKLAHEPQDITSTLIKSVIGDMLQDIPCKKATFNISVSVPYNNLFVIQIPLVNDSEIRQAIYWDLSALLPDPVDQYEFDFQVLNRDRKAKQITLIVGAVPKKNIDTVLKSLVKLANKIPVIEIDMLAALDLFLATEYDNASTIGFLQLGAEQSTYTIISKNQNPAFLSLPFGGNMLDTIISSQLGISFIAANEYRQSGELYRKIHQKSSSEAALEREIPKAIVAFIKSLIQFNARFSHNTGETVSKIYATGGLLNDRFIGDVLQIDQYFIDLPCQFWEPLSAYLKNGELESINKFAYASALGVALRD